MKRRVTKRTTELAETITALQEEIAKREEAEERIEILNANLAAYAIELEMANQELEAFSYSVSHDLRAPLRHIDGFSRALLEDCLDQLDEKGRHHLNRILAATHYLGTLIDDLLQLARVSRHELWLHSLDLSGLARDISRTLQEGSRHGAWQWRSVTACSPEQDVHASVADTFDALAARIDDYIQRRCRACDRFASMRS